VQTVACHFLVDKLEKTLATCQDPAVHDVGIRCSRLRVKNIVDVLSLLDKSDLTLKELITVPQGKHDLGDNLLDTGFLEPERFSTDNRRVNHIQSKRVRTVTLHDQGRV